MIIRFNGGKVVSCRKAAGTQKYVICSALDAIPRLKQPLLLEMTRIAL